MGSGHSAQGDETITLHTSESGQAGSPPGGSGASPLGPGGATALEVRGWAVRHLEGGMAGREGAGKRLGYGVGGFVWRVYSKDM